MVDVPDGLRYTVDHEWLRIEAAEGVVGITAYAADELGDVVFVELPRVGRTLQRSEAFGVIESVKTASGPHAPGARGGAGPGPAPGPPAGRPPPGAGQPAGRGWTASRWSTVHTPRPTASACSRS